MDSDTNSRQEVKRIVGTTGDLYKQLELCHDLLLQNREDPEFFSAVMQIAQETALQLQQQSTTDSLTGLLNEKGFREQAVRDLNLAKRAAEEKHYLLVYSDANHFKPINDRYGDSVGDKAIQIIAESLKRRLRSSDLIARLHGDEFCALMPEAGEFDAPQLVSDAGNFVNAHIQKRLKEEKIAVPTSLALGYILHTTSPVSGSVDMKKAMEQTPQQLADLLQRAERAMKYAKNLNILSHLYDPANEAEYDRVMRQSNRRQE